MDKKYRNKKMMMLPRENNITELCYNTIISCFSTFIDPYFIFQLIFNILMTYKVLKEQHMFRASP